MRCVLNGCGETLLGLAASTTSDAGLVRLPYAEILAPAKTQPPPPTAPAAGPWGEWLRIIASLCACRSGSRDGSCGSLAPSNNSGCGSRSWCEAAASGNIPAAGELLARAAQHLCDSDWTDWLRVPLIGAASQGDLAMVRLLLKAGIGGGRGNSGIGAWMIPGGDGRTLLHSAADSGNASVIDALLDAGAGVVVNAVTGGSGVGSDKSGFSPFHVAAIKGSVPAAMALARAGAAVHRTAPFMQSALHLAASTGDAEMVYALVTELRLAVEGKDDLGSTALHVAASHGKAESVRALLNLGAEVDAQDGCGRSPLFKACRCGSGGGGGGGGSPDGCEAIRELLGAGADVQARSDDGETPLHAACRYGNTEAVRLLLRHDADETASCDLKKTPWDVSTREALRASRRGSRHTVGGGGASGVADGGRDVGGNTDFPAAVAEAIHAALAAAPAGRAWRRRGWLVMLRARAIEFDKSQQEAADVVGAAAVATAGHAALQQGFGGGGVVGEFWAEGDLDLGALAQDPSWLDLAGEEELLAALEGLPESDPNIWGDFDVGLEAALPVTAASLQEEHDLPSPRSGFDDFVASRTNCAPRGSRNRSRTPHPPSSSSVLVSFDNFLREGVIAGLNNSSMSEGDALRNTDVGSAGGLVEVSAGCSLSRARAIDNSGNRRRKATWDVQGHVASAARRAIDDGDASPRTLGGGNIVADVDGFLELVLRTLEVADGPFESIVGYV